MSKLAKVKLYFQLRLADDFCKPITDHKYFLVILDAIKHLISMVEMVCCLPYKYEDHTPAINLIDAQLEKINSWVIFAREQDRLELMRILHAARVDTVESRN
jgi:hypothetical protein